MSEAKEAEDGMIAHASGVIAAGKGKIKIRLAMRLVGFRDEQAKNMTLYQKVRRKAQQMTVVDKAVPQQIGDGVETVNSTLSSAERPYQEAPSNSAGSTSVTDLTAATSDNPPTPRRLLDNSPPADSSEGKRSADDSLDASSNKKHR